MLAFWHENNFQFRSNESAALLRRNAADSCLLHLPMKQPVVVVQELSLARRGRGRGKGDRRSEMTPEECFLDVKDFWLRLLPEQRSALLRVPICQLIISTLLPADCSTSGHAALWHQCACEA